MFDLVEVLEILKDAILKHSVELVLNRGQNSRHFKRIHSTLIPVCVPVELVQIKDAEGMEHLGHASVHFCWVKELFNSIGLAL